ncbi:MAG: VOC family protein [Thermodesulfobacteriota bacterium]
MDIKNLDHLVLTVENTDKTCEFYDRVLGMKKIRFGDDRRAIEFGDQKINLHQRGREVSPAAKNPTPGSADLCFITAMSMAEVISRLEECKVEILEGPVAGTGATGPLESIYFRDPDGNLLEVSVS